MLSERMDHAATDLTDGPCSGVWEGLDGGSTEGREKRLIDQILPLRQQECSGSSMSQQWQA